MLIKKKGIFETVMGDNINRGDLVEEMLNSINESGELNSKS
jgi:hypothetical protein